MKEIQGNIWNWHDAGAYIVVPTNGYVKKNGECVMGRGIARQAAIKFPNLPKELGRAIMHTGNRVYVFDGLRIITFPVKHNWWERADPELIEKSANELRDGIYIALDELVVMPRVGCGNGRLSWTVVRPILERCLRGVSNLVVCYL